jgi:ribosome biogenesis protein ERB1
LWEVDTSLCVCVWKFDKPVSAVAWNPSPSHQLLAAVVDDKVVFITPGTGDADSTEITDALLSTGIQMGKSGGSASLDNDIIDDDNFDSDDDTGKKKTKKSGVSVAKWCVPLKDSAKNSEQQWMGSTVGVRLEIKLNGTVKRIAWHYKGDYLAVLSGSTESLDVTVHQVPMLTSWFQLYILLH